MRIDELTDLLDCYRRFPGLVFIQDRKANGARRIDIGMEKRWGELAWKVEAQLEEFDIPRQLAGSRMPKVCAVNAHFGGLDGYSR